jgi:hypothetical protein
MDLCHHGFQREACQLCRMERSTTPPVKLVEDLKTMELIGPKPRIKDPLTTLNLPDLSIKSLEPPEPILPSSLVPKNQIVDKNQDIFTQDNLKIGTEIVNPKKKYLMKK